MTKLKYPELGLYKETQANLESCISMLTKAHETCNFNSPSSFAYRSYMNNLSKDLNSYSQEMKSISSAIRKISLTYEDLEVDLNNKAKLLDNYKVEERERLIK